MKLLVQPSFWSKHHVPLVRQFALHCCETACFATSQQPILLIVQESHRTSYIYISYIYINPGLYPIMIDYITLCMYIYIPCNPHFDRISSLYIYISPTSETSSARSIVHVSVARHPTHLHLRLTPMMATVKGRSATRRI